MEQAFAITMTKIQVNYVNKFCIFRQLQDKDINYSHDNFSHGVNPVKQACRDTCLGLFVTEILLLVNYLVTGTYI